VIDGAGFSLLFVYVYWQFLQSAADVIRAPSPFLLGLYAEFP